MRLRYKKTGTETAGSTFNMHSLDEVLTGDDSPSVSELDVFLPSTGEWKDMSQAFKDHDIIMDNYNTCFFVPPTDADRERGYTLY